MTHDATPLVRRTIRRQLLLAVNATLIGLVAVFLVIEYRQQLRTRLAEKRITLEEEAKTLLPAVEQLHVYGTETVQAFVDRVCGRMREEQSPGHHIAVQFGRVTLQATAHHRGSPEMFHAMQLASMAPDGRAHIGDIELVAGRAVQADLVVYVSESLRNVRATVRSEIFRHMIGVVVLAIALAVIINLVLMRIVTRPINRLVRSVRQIGRGNLAADAGHFDCAELDYLATEITSMSAALVAADRNRAAQMQKAREIQEHLLPNHCETPGLAVASLFQPADEVGGDFYDVLPLTPVVSLFCLADVTGHGVPAAMSAAMLKSFLADAAEKSHTPDVMLEYINRRLIDVTLPGDFATMLIVRIDTGHAELSYASAGHETAWLWHNDGKLEEMKSTGLILGIRDNASWNVGTMPIRSGDRVMMVTDGVTETQRAEDADCFGRQRLVDSMRRQGHLDIHKVVDGVQADLSLFRGEAPPHDDVTLVLVEVTSSN